MVLRATGKNPLRGSDPTLEATEVESLIEDLNQLANEVQTPAEHREIRQTKELLRVAGDRGILETNVRRLTPTDSIEALVGSVVFASPLLVEDGVFDIGAFLFSTRIFDVPVFLIANTAFVVFVTYALLEWTGRDRAETHVIFGVFPARVAMILVVSFLVATVLMTVWGRVGDWQRPLEALARINVLWTVGSLGAGLGDILSERAPAALASRDPTPPSADPHEGATFTDADLLTSIHEGFDRLESTVDTEEERAEVHRIRTTTQQAAMNAGFGKRIRKYTTRDIAEAFVGSIFFSIPLLVENGVFDVAAYFLSFRLGQFPVFLILNAVFVLTMVSTLVYWAGPQNVSVSRPIFGLVPRRLIGITIISFLTAAALMTMWGRVGNWQDPVVAIARISAVWTVASFGAALGDILPGESSGSDISEGLTRIGSS
ncbi:MAG: hypothetical protein R3324_01110 [Halobacteriales archaeon]|nr:hypothetical protein [Halobacteriales archaeon]